MSRTAVGTNPLAVARELHARAVDEFNLGHVGTSLSMLRRALRHLPDHADGDGPRLAAEIWISLALAEAEASGLGRGMAALEEAQQRAEQVGDPALLVRVRYQHGTIALRAGRLARAARELAAAAELIEHAEPHDRFAILLNNGVAQSNLGRLAASGEFFRRAAEQAAQTGHRVGEFKALHNLGWLRFLSGDLPAALRTMARADRLDAPVSRGVARLDRARVLAEAGLVDEADAALGDALELLRRDRSGQDVGEVLLARAECALQGGYAAAAATLARQARGHFRRRGGDAWRRTAELVVAQAELAAGRASAALADGAARLARDLAQAGLSARASTARLVATEVLLELGRAADAAELGAAVPRAAPGEPISLRLHRRYVAARLAAATGARTAARRQVVTGLRELAEYQAGFGSIDLQTASAVHGRRLAELGRALAVSSGGPWRVLSAVERGRAVSSRLPVVEPPEDDTAARLLGELRQVVEELRGTGDDAPQRGRLARQRARLEREIKAHSWQLTGAGDPLAVASPAEIRAGLAAAGATLVCYARVGADLFAVVAGSRRATLHRLGPAEPVEAQVCRVQADLDALSARLLPGGLRAAAASSLRRGLAELAGGLLSPLELPDGPVLVSPVGLLAVLPWGLLPPLRGVPVTVTPTASGWLAGQRAGAGDAAGVLALDGPDLARSGDELAGIAAAWGGRAGTAAGAPGAHLQQALRTHAVVHVAAHGTHHAHNPLFSSLRLADGPVFAHELRRSAPHVVLSACELGLATIRPGDEALGLTSVLLRRGARCVVAGLARVRDDVAASVMVDYHAGLAGGADSATALAAALLRCPPDAPAPFACFGTTWRAPASPVRGR